MVSTILLIQKIKRILLQNKRYIKNRIEGKNKAIAIMSLEIQILT